jgi:hypothetical protein
MGVVVAFYFGGLTYETVTKVQATAQLPNATAANVEDAANAGEEGAA